MSQDVRAELIETLFDKLVQLEKMQSHLAYSCEMASQFMPLTHMDALDAGQLVQLSALKGRFAELQDHLASAMKLIANLELQDASVFTYVINYMEKIGVVADFHEWYRLRELRNKATHDYDNDEAKQVTFYNDAFAAIPRLFETLAAMKAFCQKTYTR